MELRHLRYFVMSAEELNISRAAARLRVSQPAVSRQIHDLEDELGVTLFDRDPAGLQLTPAGENFLPHARDILRRTREAVDRLGAFRAGSAVRLSVGYIALSLAGTLTPALRRFAERFPDVPVDLVELAPTEQTAALRDKRIDLALLGNPCPGVEEEFAVRRIAAAPLAAVLPDHHLLALRKKIRVAELSGEKFIGFCEKTFPDRNHIIIEACRQAGFTPCIEQVASNPSAALALVASGKGVTLMPGEASHLAHPQAVFIRLQAPAPSAISAVVWRRDDARPELAALIACCEDKEPPKRRSPGR